MIGADSSDPGREGEILQSMTDHDWWQHYGRPAPDGPLPERFTKAPGVAETIGISPASQSFPGAYYGTIGAALSLGAPMSVVSDLYVMRALSVVLAMVTLWVAWRGARAAVGEPGGLIVAFLLAVHPQFAVVSTAASPDALVILAGACVWWQAMEALNRREWTRPLAALWVAAAAGAVVDRMGIPLLVAALVLSAVVAVHKVERRSRAVAALAGAGLVVAGGLWAMDVWWNPFATTRVGYQLTLVPEAQSWGYFARFTEALLETWWFALGWVRYAPPTWWVTIVAALSACAAIGVARRFARDDARTRVLVGLATSLMAIQIAAVYWTYYQIAHGPQGKHLFPFLVPSLLLL